MRSVRSSMKGWKTAGTGLAFLIVLTVYSYKLIPFVTMSGSMLSFSLGISDAYYYVPVGIGSVLVFIPVLYKTLREIEDHQGKGF